MSQPQREEWKSISIDLSSKARENVQQGMRNSFLNNPWNLIEKSLENEENDEDLRVASLQDQPEYSSLFQQEQQSSAQATTKQQQDGEMKNLEMEKVIQEIVAKEAKQALQPKQLQIFEKRATTQQLQPLPMASLSDKNNTMALITNRSSLSLPAALRTSRSQQSTNGTSTNINALARPKTSHHSKKQQQRNKKPHHSTILCPITQSLSKDTETSTSKSNKNTFLPRQISQRQPFVLHKHDPRAYAYLSNSRCDVPLHDLDDTSTIRLSKASQYATTTLDRVFNATRSKILLQ